MIRKSDKESGMTFSNKYHSMNKPDLCMDIDDKNIIDVENLGKIYQGVPVLNSINLKVKKGDLVSIIGRSGCGKTTLLRCISCLEPFDTGRVTIAGVTLERDAEGLKPDKKFRKKASDMRKNIGMPFQDWKLSSNVNEDFRIKSNQLRSNVGILFQSLNLFPHMTVLDNIIKAPVVVRKVNKETAKKEAFALLEKVGMEGFANRYPSQLSGGQCQRVAISRALAMNPKVMLYDEPTSALDPELIEEIMQVMRKLHKEGMTQIVVTHTLSFARSVSDIVIYMEDGKFIESGKPDVLFTNPKDDRTKEYLKIQSQE